MNQRCHYILNVLRSSEAPVTASALAQQLSGKLDLSSRYDVDVFLSRVAREKNAAPISSLTGGIHLHRIGCRDRESFERIRERLLELGIAQKEE